MSLPAFIPSRLPAIACLLAILAGSAPSTFAQPASGIIHRNLYHHPRDALGLARIGNLVEGADGRLYSRGVQANGAIAHFSIGQAAGDPRLQESGLLMLPNSGQTGLIRNRQGLLLAAVSGKDPLAPEAFWNCPQRRYVHNPETNSPDAIYTFGYVYRMGADGVPAKLPVSESLPFCPTGNLAVDGQDNIYVLSAVQDFDHPAIGERLFKISADGRGMTELRTFYTEQPTLLDAGRHRPFSIFVSNDGQWLYGLNSGNASGGSWQVLPYLYRIRLADDHYEHVYTFDRLRLGANSPPGLVEAGDYLYGVFGDTTTNVQGLGRMPKDGSGPPQMLYTASRPSDGTDGLVSLGGLWAHPDGRIYGHSQDVIQNGEFQNGHSAIFRFDPAAIQPDGTGANVEVLYTFTADDAVDGSSAVFGTVGGNGRLYGTTGTRSPAGQYVWELDVGYVAPAPLIALTAQPAEVAWGASDTTVTLNWSAENAVSCEASGDWSGAKPGQGSEAVMPVREGENVYTLSCDSGSGQPDAMATRSVVVRALAPPPPVRITAFAPTQATLDYGERVTLNWTTENAISCSAQWLSPIPAGLVASGSYTFTQGMVEVGTFDYALNCTGQDGKAVTATTSVTVTLSGDNAGLDVREGGGALATLLLPLLALALRRRHKRVSRFDVSHQGTPT